MKTYNILLILTLFFSLYFLIYERYLYEPLYCKYLPNYEKEVVFPVYDGKTGQVANLSENPISDNILSYIPWYGQILYYTAMLAIFLRPVLFIVALVFGVYTFFTNKMYSKWSMILFQLFVFTSSLIMILNSPIMD